MRRIGCLSVMLLSVIVWTTIILLCSCSSPKNLQSDTKTNWSNEFGYLSNKMDSLRLNLGLNIDKTNEKLSNIKFNQTVINYSIPDSTGKQYIVSESKTEGERNDEEREQTIVRLQAELTRISNKVDSLYDLMKSMKQEKTKEVKLSWWQLYKDNVYISLIALIIVSWLVYHKRNK